MGEPKILMWDIESTGLNATFGTILCIGYKFLNDPEVHVPTILDGKRKRDMLDDKWLVERFSKIYNHCDYSVGHYSCPTPDQRILTADLRWVRAGDLVLGDRLIGFDSHGRANGIRKRRQFKTAVVTHTGRRLSHLLRIAFSDGTEVTVSPEHPFTCAKSASGNNLVWRQAGQLAVGDRVQKLFEVWHPENSYEAGWLAGMFDGEGSLSQPRRLDLIGGVKLTISQNEGSTFNQIGKVLANFGFKANPTRNAGGKVWKWGILGGRSEHTRLLGSIRPARLLAKFSPELMGRADGWFVTITAIEPTEGEIIELSTSTETYILEGLASHNSRFDLPMVRTKLLKHGLPPLPPKPHLDTWWIARRELKLHSNRLAVLQDFLGVAHSKTPLKPDDWIQAAHGSKEALAYIVEHCRQDVLVLEEVFLKLRPLAKEEPNRGLFVPSEAETCPSCGSSHLTRQGYRVAKSRRYQQWQCQSCGKWTRGIYADTEARAELV